MFGTEYRPIPTRLDTTTPGIELAALLGGINVARLSGHDQIVVLRAHDRMASYYQARRYQAIAAVVDTMGEVDESPMSSPDAAEAEIQAALSLTRRTAETEVAFALDVRRRLPRVWQAFAAGDLDLARAKTIARGTAHLPIATGRDVVARIIDHVAQLTTGELKARIEREAITADPDAARDRYQYGLKDRRVFADATPDGTANLLGLDMAPHRVTAASRYVNRLARSLRTKDESRTMDQLRADVFLDLLTDRTTTTAKTGDAGVHLQVDLDTLTALSEHPGELAGYGPVIADIARQVATEQADAEWRWAVTDPATRQVLHDGITRRRPTAGQRRTVQARHQTCVFPGCRMPAVDSDLDHRKRHTDGGATSEANLAPLCRHHHLVKDVLGWILKRLTNGNHHWTSKFGHTYATSGTPP